MNFGVRWNDFHESVVWIFGVTVIWWHGGTDSEEGAEIPPLFRGISFGLGWGALRVGWHWDTAQHMEEKLEEREDSLELLEDEHPEAVNE